MSYEADVPASAAAREKVNLPGIFLIVVGALNALAALGLLFSGVQAMMTKDKFRDEFKKGFDKALEEENKKKKMTEDQKKQVEATRAMVERFQDIGPGGMLAWGVIALLASIVTIVGAIKMRALQSRGLAITGAVLAMIPCISPMGCCLLGEAIGIWALVALSSSDVKASFR